MLGMGWDLGLVGGEHPRRVGRYWGPFPLLQVCRTSTDTPTALPVAPGPGGGGEEEGGSPKRGMNNPPPPSN